MIKLLLTAFENYGPWQDNASWLAVMDLTQDLPSQPNITTRRYPAEFAAVRERLQTDLQEGYDIVVHMDQAPGASQVWLESVGLNIGGKAGQQPSDCFTLESDGPVAFRSGLPLSHWSELFRDAEIPAQVSFHAGTYLCNACLYWTHFFSQQYEQPTRATCLHLPLATSQVIAQQLNKPSIPTSTVTRGLRLILADVTQRYA